MKRFRAFCRRLAAFLRPDRSDAELAAELGSHLALHIEDNLRTGMSPEEARRQALIKLGGLDQTKESYRARRGLPWLDFLFQDTRFGLRVLRKSPGFTAVAILTLALGIGATTAIFSLVDVVLFRPLPIDHPNQVVRITSGNVKDISYFSQLSFPMYLQLRDRTNVFSGVAASIDRLSVNFSSGLSGSQRIVSSMVTGNFFHTLGVKPALGRTIDENDDRPGAAPVAMISHDFWRTQFAGSANALGASAVIDGQQVVIVGVAPPDFGGVEFDNLPKVWLPITMGIQLDPLLKYQMPLNDESFEPFLAVARLKPGVAVQTAQAQLDSIAAVMGAGKPIAREYGFNRQWPVLVPAEQEARDKWTQYSFLILGTVLLVLLIASANVSGLLLAHSEGRRKEIAVRAALGATRTRIIRLQLIQGLLIAFAGSVIGCLLAAVGASVLLAAAPVTSPIPPDRAVSILDPRVLAFALVAAILSGLVSGLGPALRSSHADLISSMKGEGFVTGASARRFPLHNLFVVVQVAASVVLLVGAGLLARTIWQLVNMPLGFDTAHIMTASTDPIRQGYDKSASARLLDPLLNALRSEPGVQSAALVTGIPIEGAQTTVSFESQHSTGQRGEFTYYDSVTPGYFAALGIPLLQGRDFLPTDTASSLPVAIVDETAVRRYWPSESPIGKHILKVGPHDEALEVIGVVGDVTTGYTAFDRVSEFYVPLSQGYLRFPFQPDITMIARGTGDPNALLPEMRAALQRIDPNLPLFQIHTMEEQVERTQTEQRFLSRVLLIFAMIATLLCAAGIYAQTSYATTALTREFGIRMALGAQPSQVFRMVLRRDFWLSAGGLVIGFAAAIGLTRVVASLLFHVSPLDPVTFLAVAIIFGGVVAAACLVPARRAMRVDPVSAMRSE